MTERLDRGEPAMPSRCTAKQGQYLAFILYYTRIHGRPPAETDFQQCFRVSGPTAHQMIGRLDRSGLISRQPGVARSIRLLVARDEIPALE
jgi:Mn-dependent DtxR family transcriptional regulator